MDSIYKYYQYANFEVICLFVFLVVNICMQLYSKSGFK